MSSIQIKRLVLGSMENNCYILTCPETLQGVIIDPGAEEENILKKCEGLRVNYILITHNHPDHIGALIAVKEATGAPVAVHFLDASQFPISPDILLKDKDILKAGRLEFQVIHTPGHTPGGVCFLIDKHLFSGDTIFHQGIGNTAFPGGDYFTLIKSIKEKIFVLPDLTVIYPGHGSQTTVAKEKNR